MSCPKKTKIDQVEVLIPVQEEDEEEKNGIMFSAAVDTVFQTPEILEKICDLLDFGTLRESRLVSSLWMTESTKRVLKKYSIRVPSWYKLGNRPPFHRSQMNLPWEVMRKQQHKAALHELLTSKHPHLLINLVITSFEDIEQFFDFDFNFLLAKVRQLKYDTSCRDSMENLFRLLEKMPNLQTLTTSCLDLSPDQTWLQQQNNQDKFLRKLESLQDIKTTFEPTPVVFNSWMTFRDRLRAIKEFHNPEHKMMSSLLASGKVWLLHKLTLNVDTKNLPPKLLRQFFNLISDSLQDLSIRFMSGLDPSDYTWDETCHDPLVLLYNLRKLKLSCFSRHPPDHMSMRKRGLIVALQFQKLQYLDICLDGYNVPITELDSSEVPFLVEKASQSLQELTFHVTGREGHHICHLGNLNQSVYPRLRVLKLHLELFHPLTPTALATIFKDMKNLRRLVLRIAEDICKGLLKDTSPVAARQRIGRWERAADDQVNWDEILSGVPRQRPLMGLLEEEEEDEEEINHTTIKCLQDLTSLKIINVSSCPISDYFVYNGLVQLKGLQSLVIQGHLFSQKAVNKLKDTLGIAGYLSVHENPPYRKCNYVTPTGGHGESTSRLFL